MNEPVRSLRSIRETAAGFAAVADNAAVEVDLYGPDTVRVSIRRPEAPAEPFSYAVIARPSRGNAAMALESDPIALTTDHFRLEMDRDPIRFRLKTLDGRLVNADDPAFGTSWIGEEVTTYKRLMPGERFLGLGEKTGDLDRAGSAFENWNTDAFGYPAEGGQPLYASIPFFIGVHSGLVYGLFLDNSHRTRFNFGAANHRFSSFSAEAGAMDYYLFHGETIADILRAYTRLTGRAPLPPLWSLGFQQCRYSYFPDSEVLRIARTFREKKIPADAIYLDIHYMDRYKVFTWDPERFPDPAGLTRSLRELGFRTVVILDPGIKTEPGYAAFEDGKRNDVFLRYPDGERWTAEVWPGRCHFPDFTKPTARSWWANRVAALARQGVEGFWTDMNEPAVWGREVPNLIVFDREGRGATHRTARNVYGMQMARATRKGAESVRADRRAFVLSRAGFAGIQRYAALWTGDNISSDDHLMAGVRLVNSLGMSGVAFAGVDIGGFAGEAAPDLFARWIAIGALSPLCRAHTMANSRSAEPWAFGERVEGITRNYLNLRYRLLPYIYAAFETAARTGTPVARPLAFEFPHDPLAYAPAYQSQYLFGDHLLVVPVRSDERIARVYLPAGLWYDFYTDERIAGPCERYAEAPPERLPLFVRGGGVLTMTPPRPHTGAAPAGPLRFHLYPVRPGDPAATSAVYEDDGDSPACRDGLFLRRELTLAPGRFRWSRARGRFISPHKSVELVFHGGEPTDLARLTVDGIPARPHAGRIRHFEPLDRDDDPYGEVRTAILRIPYGTEPCRVAWRTAGNDPPPDAS